MDEPPLCNSLYVRSCTKDACSFYHPEVNRSALANFRFLIIVLG